MTKSESTCRTISYIANVRIPSEKANSIQILKMCDAFCSVGLNVELVVPFRFQNLGFKGLRDIHSAYSLEHGFPIRRVYSPDFVPLERFLLGYNKIFFLLQSVIFAFLVVLRSLIMEKRSWYYTRDLWVALLLSFYFPVRVVFELHHLPGSLLRKALLRRIIRRGVPIVSVTAVMKKILAAEYGAENENVLVCPNGYDSRLFNTSLSKSRARKICGLPEDKLIAGYFGRARITGESKGVEQLVEAARQIHDERIILLLVGDDFNKLISHRGVELRSIPHIPQSEMLPYLRSCDYLMMPFPKTTIFANYISPIKLFEYMAVDIPIITTDLPNIREIVGDDDVLFTKDNSPEQIAEAIIYLERNPEHAKALAESSLRKSRDYTWKHRAESILTFLDSVQDVKEIYCHHNAH